MTDSKIYSDVYKIEKIRDTNNTLWMNILRIALRESQEETQEVLRRINKNDINISELLKEIARSES